MGIQDRDWWREESRKREARMNSIHVRFTDPSDGMASVRKTARTGALVMTVFWLVLMGIFYAGFKYYENARASRFKAYSLQATEMVIPRGRDGHFRVNGEINGQPVEFLVDTGASTVSVTDAFAQRAGLQGGQATTFITANGPRPGRMLRGVPVLAGNMAASHVNVATGLYATHDHEALLGQSYLSQFDVILRKDHMLLKRRTQSNP